MRSFALLEPPDELDVELRLLPLLEPPDELDVELRLLPLLEPPDELDAEPRLLPPLDAVLRARDRVALVELPELFEPLVEARLRELPELFEPLVEVRRREPLAWLPELLRCLLPPLL